MLHPVHCHRPRFFTHALGHLSHRRRARHFSRSSHSSWTPHGQGQSPCAGVEAAAGEIDPCLRHHADSRRRGEDDRIHRSGPGFEEDRAERRPRAAPARSSRSRWCGTKPPTARSCWAGSIDIFGRRPRLDSRISSRGRCSIRFLRAFGTSSASSARSRRGSWSEARARGWCPLFASRARRLEPVRAAKSPDAAPDARDSFPTPLQHGDAQPAVHPPAARHASAAAMKRSAASASLPRRTSPRYWRAAFPRSPRHAVPRDLGPESAFGRGKRRLGAEALRGQDASPTGPASASARDEVRSRP